MRTNFTSNVLIRWSRSKPWFLQEEKINAEFSSEIKKFHRFEKKVFKLCKINGEWDEKYSRKKWKIANISMISVEVIEKITYKSFVPSGVK